ncbi:MAG: glutamine-hydrolyzing GMP synthase [Acidimicrobiales bacterium]
MTTARQIGAPGQPQASAAGPVLVLDFGAQYAQLIARRIREALVHSEIVPGNMTAQEVLERRPAGLVLSGGPSSVYATAAPGMDPALLRCGVPVLGICYGAQLMAQQLGGRVERTPSGEYGAVDLVLHGHQVAGSVIGGFSDGDRVWMSHSDSIVEAPEGFQVTSSTAGAKVASFEDPSRLLYGLQFHPEVVHTSRGREVFQAFLDACRAERSWSPASVLEAAVSAVAAQVGGGRAVCALSGGVDSGVAAAIVSRAIGDRLTCVFVDNGLLRAGEAAQVEEVFGARFDLIKIEAGDRFLSRLKGIVSPEEKRKAVGETFIRVFEEVAGTLEDARYLVQGTLYPDVVESGGGERSVIKSHHNVGGIPEDMGLDLIEPLRWLFKDEVRKVGALVGLPDEVLWRQPFPGPGLSVRIVGEVTQQRLEVLRSADAIVAEETRRAGLERELWQVFAVLPAIRTVGVMGDERTYGYPIVIRAVTSEDAMTADWARLDHSLLQAMSSRITNEVPGVNRVAYDITSKPPGTIEWE